jgi:hypothetical protein
MKSISDILAGAQILLPMSFDLQACFEEYLNPEQRTFLALLGMIEESPPLEATRSTMGRPAFNMNPCLM